MKVKCIDNKYNAYTLTVGKIYEVERETRCYYVLTPDHNPNISYRYKKNQFTIIGDDNKTNNNDKIININIGNKDNIIINIVRS